MYDDTKEVFDAADLLYGSFIKYDRLYEMTKFAFYGKTDSNSVNIFIDAYSILRTLYSRGQTLMLKDSCAIASCLINLAIHLRAYFDTRHQVATKVYIIYGGARPQQSMINFYLYNSKNILMEDSNYLIKSMIMDNLNIVKILAPYLYDIFCIIDEENEFSVISSSIINSQENQDPNIIYSKDPLAYQLVAFKPKTFLYRPKKKSFVDASWVATKSTLYNAYRYGELNIQKQVDCKLNVQMFSIYQAISGVRSRSIPSLKSANTTIKILETAIDNNIFSNGYNSNSILYTEPNPFGKIFCDGKINPLDVVGRFAAIDLPYQTMLYENSIAYKTLQANIINLYNPQEVRNINDKYFRNYPLDLNRV